LKAGSGTGDTRMSVFTQGNTYNAQTERLRIGDLNGVGGYSTEHYGIWLGNGTKEYFHVADDSTAKIAGYHFNDTSLYSGVGVYNNANTPFFQSASGKFSLGNKLTWDGSTLNVTGTITLTGSYSWDSLLNKPTRLGQISQIDSIKLAGIEAYATHGANWDTSLSGIPIRFANTPTGSGLYLSSDHLGFYNGSTWTTYMDNTGGFYLGGYNGLLQWNGSSLNIWATTKTASAGKRVEIRTSDNEMEFYDGAGAIVRVGSAVDGVVPGILVSGGRVYSQNSYQDYSPIYGSCDNNIQAVAANFIATGTGQNMAISVSAGGGTQNYSFYGNSGNIYNAGNVNIGSGYHYQINGTNLTYTDVGALGLHGTADEALHATAATTADYLSSTLMVSQGGTGSTSFTNGKLLIASTGYGVDKFILLVIRPQTLLQHLITMMDDML